MCSTICSTIENEATSLYHHSTSIPYTLYPLYMIRYDTYVYPRLGIQRDNGKQQQQEQEQMTALEQQLQRIARAAGVGRPPAAQGLGGGGGGGKPRGKPSVLYSYQEAGELGSRDIYDVGIRGEWREGEGGMSGIEWNEWTNAYMHAVEMESVVVVVARYQIVV